MYTYIYIYIYTHFNTFDDLIIIIYGPGRDNTILR